MIEGILWCAAYGAIALLCVYCTMRVSGDELAAHMMLFWPIALPYALISMLFNAVIQLADRR